MLLFEKYFLGFLLVVKYFLESFRNTQLRRSLFVGLSSPSPGLMSSLPGTSTLSILITEKTEQNLGIMTNSSTDTEPLQV